MKRFYLILFFQLCLIECSFLSGQVNDPRFSGRPTDIKEPSDSIINRPALEYKYVLSGDLNTIQTFGDTTLGNGFMYVDPVRKQNQEYIHLGYLGSSAYPLTFNPIASKGFNIGFHQYDIYNQHVDSVRFYKTNRTVADLSFYQISGNQDNFNSNADYSQSFKDGITVNVNFHRYNFDGLYNNAQNQTTSFAFGLVLDNEKLPFDSYLLFLSNINNESHNGGIVDYNSLSLPNNTFRSNVSVSLQNAQNRNTSKLIKWHLEKKIFGDRVKASYNLTYNWEEFFYYDTGVSSNTDQIVYQSFIVDDRGIRFNLKNKRISNEIKFDVSVIKKLALNVGLLHDLYIYNDGIDNSTRNDLTVLFDGLLNLNKNAGINLNGYLGIGSNAGNFLVNASTSLKLKKWLGVRAKWSSYLYEAPYISENLVLNDAIVFQNNFTKILGTSLEGELSIPIIGLSLSAQQHVLNNAIFWDENALPQQYGGVFSNTNFTLRSKFKVWKFGFENAGTYQFFSENLYNLPDWYTTHNVYFESSLFRNNLLLRLGTNARIIPASQTVTLMPLTGQFYQDGYNSTLYPEWGAYISAKVSKFRIIFEYDNLAYWFTDQVNFNVTDYPNLDGNLRFGIRWLLLD